jgi:hypothetical protein
MLATDQALAAHQKLINTPPPPRDIVKALRLWFPGGNFDIPLLSGESKRIFDDYNDLVALKTPTSRGKVLDFVVTRFSLLFVV